MAFISCFGCYFRVFPFFASKKPFGWRVFPKW